MSEHFQKIVNVETVASFGVDMSVWGEDEQASLHEGMILAMKENPDWTEEEVKKECAKQVNQILFDWFKDNLGYLVQKTNYWMRLEYAFQEFRSSSLKDFLKLLKEKQEFQDFGEEFYDDLRQMWNICSAGMEDEFQRMKRNNWTFQQYRSWLNKEMKKSRRKN